MKKSILGFLLAGIMAVSFTACTTGGTSSAASSAESGTLTDREGNEVQIPDSLERIVSLSPSNTEILAGLGLADKIIAADTHSADAGVDAAVATIDMMNVNIEAISALKPDAVFLNGMSQTGTEDPYATLKDAGVQVIYIPSAASLADIQKDITFMAGYTKTADKGEKLLADMDSAVSELKAIGDTITEKKKVYFEVSEAPNCYSTGTGTYLNEMLEIIGAENVFADQENWISVTEESVIAANPDVILTSVAWEGYDFNEILARAGWEATNAVKNKAVYAIPSNPTSRASQNVVEGMKSIAQTVYPELYK